MSNYLASEAEKFRQEHAIVAFSPDSLETIEDYRDTAALLLQKFRGQPIDQFTRARLDQELAHWLNQLHLSRQIADFKLTSHPAGNDDIKMDIEIKPVASLDTYRINLTLTR